MTARKSVFIILREDSTVPDKYRDGLGSRYLTVESYTIHDGLVSFKWVPNYSPTNVYYISIPLSEVALIDHLP